MTLRLKTLVTMAVTLALLMAAIYLISSRILLSAYAGLEEQDMMRDTRRAGEKWDFGTKGH